MPNPEIVNVLYLVAVQWVSRDSRFGTGGDLRQTLPKFSRLVAVFGQQGEVAGCRPYLQKPSPCQAKLLPAGGDAGHFQ